mgnify:CR=1 FL=1
MSRPALARPAFGRPLPFLRRVALLDRVMALVALHRQRRQLREMEPWQLADLGLSRSEARAESDRPVWNPPSWWR